MSVEITSIVISVISLSGTILATCVGAYMTYYSEERKARREVNKILLKYRDPLLLSAQDLQARLYGLSDTTLLEFLTLDEPGEETYKDTVYIYTAYVVGQYLSWVWILRRQAQFMALMSSSPPQLNIFSWGRKQHSASALMQKIDKIKLVFGDDMHGNLEKPFILFKAHQTCIGEIMSCQDTSSNEYYCMGFATFSQRWKMGSSERHHHHAEGTDHDHGKIGEYMAGVSKIPDQDFRKAFRSIEDGINTMWKHRQRSREFDANHVWNMGSDGRLRRLQHLLLDLTNELDPQGLLNNEHENKRVAGVPGCLCDLAPCHTVPLSRAGARTISGGIKTMPQPRADTSHERNGAPA